LCRRSELEIATVEVDLCRQSGLEVVTVEVNVCRQSGLEIMTVEVDFRLPQEWTLLGTTGVSVCRCTELKRKAFVMLSC
jgi:hypothetical protein